MEESKRAFTTKRSGSLDPVKDYEPVLYENETRNNTNYNMPNKFKEQSINMNNMTYNLLKTLSDIDTADDWEKHGWF